LRIWSLLLLKIFKEREVSPKLKPKAFHPEVYKYLQRWKAFKKCQGSLKHIYPDPEGDSVFKPSLDIGGDKPELVLEVNRIGIQERQA